MNKELEIQKAKDALVILKEALNDPFVRSVVCNIFWLERDPEVSENYISGFAEDYFEEDYPERIQCGILFDDIFVTKREGKDEFEYTNK